MLYTCPAVWLRSHNEYKSQFLSQIHLSLFTLVWKHQDGNNEKHLVRHKLMGDNKIECHDECDHASWTHHNF